MKRKVAAAVLAVLIALTLAFIWGHSLASRQESLEESGAALSRLTPFLELFVGKGNVTDHLVRKLAHFTEFGALGFELMLFAAVRNRFRLQPAVNCMFAGLVTAVTDETIQIFSGRGPMVSDVVLDFGGVCAGIAAAALCVVICTAVRRRKNPAEKQRI